MTAATPLPSPALKLEYAFSATVHVANPIEVGQVPAGRRRFIPITGGDVQGPLLNARVLPGSGDWQVVRSDGVISLGARYVLETPDGTRIAVDNRGLRHGAPEVMARLSRGEPVAPTEYYFRTAAEFEAPVASPYAWLNNTLFVATAERGSDVVRVHFFRVL